MPSIYDVYSDMTLTIKLLEVHRRRALSLSVQDEECNDDAVMISFLLSAVSRYRRVESVKEWQKMGGVCIRSTDRPNDQKCLLMLAQCSAQKVDYVIVIYYRVSPL